MDIPDLIAQLSFARSYTLRLLDRVPASDWFRIPDAGVSHIGWQVGHLTIASYRLALERIRGQLPDDSELLSDEFLAQFGRDSKPTADPTVYPSAEELRKVFDRVHERILRELPSTDPESLDLPPFKPHILCATRRACIVWCAHHELVHAGQIGLIRRQLGHDPVW